MRESESNHLKQVNVEPIKAHSCCSSSATKIKTTHLIDPVCGMTVTADSPHVLQHEGQSVYFCNAGCKSKFAANPAKYMLANNYASVEMTADQYVLTDSIHMIYTCPMHPEVRQDHQGSCPKCGMALEPEMPTLDEGENPELVDFKRRFIWTLPLIQPSIWCMPRRHLQQ